MPTKRTRVNSNYGYPAPVTAQVKEAIIQPKNPSVYDQAEIGQSWINSVTGAIYMYSLVAGDPTWVTAPVTPTATTQLTVDPGDVEIVTGNLVVDAGNVNILTGNANIAGTLLAGATTIVGATSITGNTVVDGDLAITGDVTITGDFDLTNTASTLIQSSNNVVGAITLQATGGAAATELIENVLGTDPEAIKLNAAAGGVTIEGALNTAAAITLNATDVDGGITITGGTSGVVVTASAGDVNIVSLGGAINLVGDTAVAGSLAVTGDFDIDNTASTTIHSSNNAAGAITLLADGGAAATEVISNTASTSLDSIYLSSTLGGIHLAS